MTKKHKDKDYQKTIDKMTPEQILAGFRYMITDMEKCSEITTYNGVRFVKEAKADQNERAYLIMKEKERKEYWEAIQWANKVLREAKEYGCVTTDGVLQGGSMEQAIKHIDKLNLLLNLKF